VLSYAIPSFPTPEAALKAIAANLKSIKSAISAMGHRADLPTTKGGDEVKLVIEGNGVRVKVEVNFVFRGTVLPVVQRPLISTAQDIFTTDITLPVLDTAELYGGKLVAAMDRQHPRDIFDALKMIERFGWQPSFVDCFVAYLAGHNRPVHEVLFPKLLSLEPAFTNEFAGMTRDGVALDLLKETQEHLIAQLPRALSTSHREFLLSLVRAEPAWELMPFNHLQHLPALQWKLLNLRKLIPHSKPAHPVSLIDHRSLPLSGNGGSRHFWRVLSSSAGNSFPSTSRFQAPISPRWHAASAKSCTVAEAVGAAQ